MIKQFLTKLTLIMTGEGFEENKNQEKIPEIGEITAKIKQKQIDRRTNFTNLNPFQLE